MIKSQTGLKNYIMGMFFSFIFGAIWLILVVLALFDLFQNSSIKANTKLLWLIIILIAPVFGSLVYLFWGKHQSI